MKILIGYEESQTVCMAFRDCGHDAYSNDIVDCSGGNKDYHLKMDFEEALQLNEWDFIGIHPVCKKLTLSGNRTYAFGKHKYNERLESVQYTINIWEKVKAASKYAYMENPMGAMNTDNRLNKPQIIQPYYFGDEYQKTTCLWLHNLPPLLHHESDNLFSKKTHVEKGEMFEWKDGKTGKIKRQPLWYAQSKGFGGKQKDKDYSKTRSKTFPGIAKAMAEQWGNLNT